MVKLSEQELVRREKLDGLRKLGINPYPASQFPVNFYAKNLTDSYTDGKEVILAGRLMSRRIQGKASFAELLDSSGRIQIYFNRDEICLGEDKTLYNQVYKKLLDIGDIIGIEGTLFTTMVGQQTVKVTGFTVLSKTLRPLPLPKTDVEGNSYDEFNDPELRYRQRYVDLIVNSSVKNTFLQRSKITTTIRDFLTEKEYLEVETPILQPIPGGATARPFVTHHNALNTPLYLRIANELYLKRLIVGGFEGVFEFAKDFRNEGMDRTHNPEFTVMELYVAYKDYFWMMETTETLIEKIAMDVHGKSELTVGDHQINFKAPYPRITILEAINTHTGIDISEMNENQLRETAKKLGLEVNDTMGEGKLIDEIFGEKCEHHYIQPTFITDYPKSMSPLTKEHRSNTKLTERFELMVNGRELANAYSELNDPIDQRERFEAQLNLSEKGDDEAMFIDQDFLRALEYGMPPTSGIGIGIDRLVMLMTNNSSIQEVLFFPQMKPEQKAIPFSEEEKSILKVIKESEISDLGSIKTTVGLSNKKWDVSVKSLTQKNIVKITKNDEGLFIEIL
ncbi:lysine--tRNA ligase [Flavobacteriaceae bacterium]|nr:lysine--tRNA ligase [Flavobacteriaceae bacterium]